ncbi:MAG: trypsin-like peptidase domain-containing protein [Planctomycetota bacterium]|nr:trypsin-like peptidase domain-containing protein [Planctomycetota bacterium]MDA1252733.1 trypsin-like peptidase domain-containing protein [Planctomycetota bacterium]
MLNRLIQFGLCLTFIALAASAEASVRETPVVRAIRRAQAAVANIHSEKTADDGNSLFAVDRARKVNGMGTGVIIDERGYIVTNHHVVDGVDSLRVTTSDGSAYTAQVVSYDRKRDLAIIKINATRPLQVVPLGTSSDLMLGETVIAVGNAYGYENSMTQGIISALSRDVEVNEKQAYRNLIQTDASINPGNSGGPLINLEGEIIGINVAIRAGAQRIGFAIPIDDARDAIASLLNVEKLSHTWHGLKSTDVKNGPVRKLVAGATVTDSPAARAGLQPGDVILTAGSVQTIDGADFERACLGRKPGETIALRVERGGKITNLNMTLAPVEEKAGGSFPTETLASRSNTIRDSWNLFGVRLSTLQRKDELAGTKFRGGLLVTQVDAQSVAARNGIREGDILVGLDKWETISSQNVQYVLENEKLWESSPLTFYVQRGRETLFGRLPLR